jgi:L-seryl-tRNA(Ser) seleniumtransferase
VCAALASGREVVISRGELIEIGGSFRIPDVLSASGAVLREVGTTNRTHLRDYERAVGPDTAMLLSVHPSNYRIVGFTAAPALADLAGLAKRRGIPLVFDAGSGLVAHPLGDEPVVPDALTSGAALVCFSGDKLYGGPQAGIVCGRAALIDRLRRHPLLRALRPDKTTLAALEATTLAYLDGTVEELPVWDMLDAPAGILHRRATRLARALGEAGYTADVIQGESVTGGGSLPEHAIASAVVRVRHETLGPTKLAAALREGDPPVIARIESRAVVVDVRTVHRREDRALLDAFRRCVRPPDEPTPTGRPRRR